MAGSWKELAIVDSVLHPRECQEFVLQSSPLQTSTSFKHLGGGAFLRGSSSTNSSTSINNRFLVWRAVDGCLELSDLSLNVSLHSNGIRIQFGSCRHLAGGVSIREAQNGLNLLFSTSSRVHCFIFPIPHAETSGVSSESPHASVLASFSEADCSNVDVEWAPNSMEPHAASTWLSPNGDAWFALASLDGNIRIVFLPADRQAQSVQFDLKQTSMMQRLWKGLAPLTMRGSSSSADAVLSVCLQEIGADLYVLALCRDLKLRIWSATIRECVESADLSLLLLNGKTSLPEDQDHRIVSVSGHGSEPKHMFALYLSFTNNAQVSVVNVTKTSSGHMLVQLESNSFIESQQLGRLLDLTCSERGIFGLWSTENGAELCYRSFKSCIGWQFVDWDEGLDGGFDVAASEEPREVYLDHLFKNFSRHVIVKALQLFRRTDVWTLLDLSLDELRRQVSIAVESQVQEEASSFEIQHEEYRELQLVCWHRFFEGCKQYAKMDNEPLGLMEDSETGLVCVVKRTSLSFLCLREPLESIFTQQQASYRDHTVFGDKATGNGISTLIMCARLVKEQMDELNLFVDLTLSISEVRDQVDNVADVILSHSRTQSNDESAVQRICTRLQTISSLVKQLSDLMKLLDGKQHLDEIVDDENDIEHHFVCSQLFSNYLGISVLSRAFTQTVDIRLSLCLSLAVVIQIAASLGQRVGLSMSHVSHLSSNVLPQMVTLSCAYHSLLWICGQGCMQTSSNAMEANLRHLSALNLSEILPSQNLSLQSELPLSLLNLFLMDVGGTRLRLALTRHSRLSSPALTERCLYWTTALSIAVTTLIYLLWPDKQDLVFCEFLVAQCQYTSLQMYLDLLHTLAPDCSGTVCFLRGQSFLHAGQHMNAHYWFMKAAPFLDEPYLLQMTSEDGSELTKMEYYAKLMQIYELVSASDLVVQVSGTALLDANPDNENTPIFWSGKFKHLLELNDLGGAYSAMISNPDPVRRKDCLYRFIAVLCEQGRFKEVCSFPYVGLQDEVVSLIELRAQSSDVTTGVFYDLLYSFHITRRSFRRAAFSMYEYATRLSRERNNLQSLQKQAKCYLAAMNALHIVERKSAWIIRPTEWDAGKFALGGVIPRHYRRPGRQGSALKRSLQVLEVKELKKEYILVLAHLKLLQYSSDSVIAEKHGLSPEETLALLVQAGLFDTAMEIANVFKLQFHTIFETLVSRCVKLSMSPVVEKQDWEWLKWNDSMKKIITKEMTVAEQAWQMLQFYQKRVRRFGTEVVLTFHSSVTSRLLVLGSVLPQWLVDSYLKHFPSELLQHYLQFDLLKEAARVALGYVNAVQGQGKEFYGLQNGVHATEPAVWLPYTALEQLVAALERAPAGSVEWELTEIQRVVSEYHNLLESISRDVVTVGNGD
ncbi:nuclear pore complex protein Nup160-like isoform X2 [Corticium candelabrum]|uniref:nuclear pore complex protein Nup160-like isoform X2 n=1 Tax=Corticium candelabrum TaxID=121492 RepID=UPI002E25DFC3|nr:nuclear pore complex protein Nup160-like isoform X2 [Corticium candelabrum]